MWFQAPLYPNRFAFSSTTAHLHTWPFMGLYALMTVLPQTRLVGLGLVIHMLLDATDCLWMGWPGGI
ncbi:DUF6122 family protein [Desulfosarcina ovata]|uniref:Uncharacterized protein n=1 Tax=Desulfosarcina ovata subsp. ovata TaxID=2752305 RepID=A0A5K8AC86_9BACT|nr:DUF6122 family protein [Desulfosarcina ovata]BBO90126.1 hypothetical protein DSCOOX_33060 [Desulfosarcina ovata subsp. ovata]